MFFLPLIKKAIKPLAKSVFMPLGLTAAASGTDASIHKKFIGSGTAILINFKWRNGRYFKESDLLIKVACGII